MQRLHAVMLCYALVVQANFGGLVRGTLGLTLLRTRGILQFVDD